MFKRQARVLFTDCEPGNRLDSVLDVAQSDSESLFEYRGRVISNEQANIDKVVLVDMEWADLVVILDNRVSYLAECLPATTQLKSWHKFFENESYAEGVQRVACERVKGLAGGLKMLARADNGA